MLRFFRQIRQRLLTDNRFNKYLLYAIGEIVLVVVGILIALQINNWNDDRKKQRELDILFQDTEEYLFPLSNWSVRFARNYQALDSMISVLNSHSTPDFYENNPDLIRYLFNDSLSLKLETFYWVSPGMQDLINLKTDFKENQKPLIYDLIQWKDISQEVKTLTYSFDEYLEGLQQRLVDKAPFILGKDPESERKAIDFVCCSGWYRYELSKVQQFTRDLVKAMDLHWGAYGELYGQLMLVKQNYTPEEMDALFLRIGRIPALPLADFSPSGLKKTSEFVPNRGIFMPNDSGEVPTWWHLLLNNSQREATIQVLYKGWIVGQWRLSTNNIARRRIPEEAILKVIYDDSTASYHTTGRGRYLVID